MDDLTNTGASTMPDLSGAIEKLLAHPELLSTVASVLGKPLPASVAPSAPPSEPSAEPSQETSEEDSAPSEIPEAISALSPMLSGLSKGGALLSPRGDDHRACLLRALKPYLKAERCETIDTLLRLLPLAELLRTKNQRPKGGP